jgi:hypothetical protein
MFSGIGRWLRGAGGAITLPASLASLPGDPTMEHAEPNRLWPFGGPSSTSPNTVRPDAPQGTRGLPAPFQQPDHPSTMRYPMWPTPPAPGATPTPPIGGGPGNVMEAPTGTPAAAPPGRRINPARVNLGQGAPGLTAPVQAPANSPFIGIDRPNSGPNERNRGSPQATALDLSSLFSHPAVAAAAAAHPAVQAAGRAISSSTNQPMPMSTDDINYGLPDARGAPYPYAVGPPRAVRRQGSTGGGY